MKAAFTLTPAESKRLIARAIVQMDEVQAANEKGYIILAGGISNAYVRQELLGEACPPNRHTAGISTSGVVCVTDEGARGSFPTVIHQGKVVKLTMVEALKDFHKETVMIKGANAVDADGNVGVITSGFDGGTVGNSLGIMTSTGLKYIVPVGLEKLVASVPEAVKHAGAKTFDYSLGANFGMFLLPNAIAVTEIRALQILANVDVKHLASGGVGGNEGAVILVAIGANDNVRRAIAIVEGVKGEPAVPAAKRRCVDCPYDCHFRGTSEADLPAWLIG